MQFIHHPDPQPQIVLTGDEHKYLFKVRRVKKDDPVKIRTLKDDCLYIYKIDSINKKEALLTLAEKKIIPQKPHKKLHLAWCVIDPKNIEKTLPALNEIGVFKITFVYCDFSQKNFRLKMDRIEKILINSCQQCGRSSLMEIEVLESSDEFFKKYRHFYALDFNGDELGCRPECSYPYLIGPEGGFSKNERMHFDKTFRLKGFILRSETAAVATAAKIIL